MINPNNLRHNSSIKRLFNTKTEDGRGRSSMLASTILSAVITNIIGGIFYTGYLVGHGIDMVNIGILIFIPFIASGFSLLSPLVLERIPRRKWVLALSRLTYYAIRIPGLILLPKILTDPVQLYTGLALTIFVSSSINSLFSAGYPVWHINFLPESIRADYFNTSSTIANFIAGVFTLLSAILADSLASADNKIGIINSLYVVGFLLAIVEVVVLSLPKEYEYQKSENQRLGMFSVIRLAFSQKKFIHTMYIMFGYTFASQLTASVINAHLLSNIGVSFTFVTAINSSYFLFFILFGAAAKRLIFRYEWFKPFALAVIFLAPTYFLYAFADRSNYTWIMLIVRLSQHFLSVMIAITYANFPYINLPVGDRTSYMSFYSVFVNFSALLAMLVGTGFVSLMGDFTFTILGKPLGSVQILMLCTGVLFGLLGYVVLRWIPRISPTAE